MTWEMVPEPTGQERRRGPSSPWWVLISVGAIVIAAGVGLLIWPFIAASWILVLLFGSALIANGLAAVVRLRASGAATIGGMVLMIAGVLAIVFSEFTAQALVTFVGVGLIAVGAFGVILVTRLSQGGFPITILPAVLAVAAGAFALIWPDIALAIVAVFAGLVTVGIGASMVWGGLVLRRAIR